MGWGGEGKEERGEREESYMYMYIIPLPLVWLTKDSPRAFQFGFHHCKRKEEQALAHMTAV